MVAAAERDLDEWIGARDVAVLVVLWTTGLRRSSVAARCENLRREGDRTVLRAWAKGDKQLDVVLVYEAEAALERWLKLRGSHDGPLFPRKSDGRALSADGVYRVVVKRAGEAGCAGKVAPHMMRAALATQAFDLGLPAYEVQGALGHARPSTTQRYDRGRRGGRALDAVAEKRRAGHPGRTAGERP